MTCDYCQTDHEAQNCPNCGAPRTSKAGDGAYRLIERLLIEAATRDAIYKDGLIPMARTDAEQAEWNK